ncbi:helix-turn-helix transcriptional regulator [Streptomyces avidinii]|uniref:DNA-binding transcriptional regulator YafY n=1 Tax=Streptomyces avidinii TaxID=1895 RepID=A0ABS4KWN2_STRAV|nr:WYL domain-containing protein [Streptomyces avidinii]MBP2034441.1 putative DNA-binding transcriptional regulator YafY [Streptomyces avidinii]GGY86286.1 transcriptional regulator [Streptomyces avidinii]
MRADRLVATLLFLQERGRVTVPEVAAELEVSERTARRDLEALAAAGIPVYSQRGRGGGWSLVGGARTNLTGLTADEIRALFLVTGPLSATPELRTTLRKLVRALPPTMRAQARAATRAGVVDATDWSRNAVTADAAHRSALQGAVVDGIRVRLGYAGLGKPAGERAVDPLGLVAKAGVDYLVAGTDKGLRTFRLSRVTSVEPTGEPVARPPDFDLATAWRTLSGAFQDGMYAVTARARVHPDTLGLLQRFLGGRVRVGGTLPDGWTEVWVDGPAAKALAGHLAGLGARVEVLEPPEVRQWLARIAAELTGMYAGEERRLPAGSAVEAPGERRPAAGPCSG